MKAPLDWLWSWSPGGWRRLTPWQRKGLAKAIDAGFPTPGQLATFASQNLNLALADISSANDTKPDLIDKLITWAESSDRLDEFLKAIAEDRDGNTLVTGAVTKVRSELPLAARMADSADDASRSFSRINAVLTLAFVVLLTIWLFAVVGVLTASLPVGAYAVLHVIATASVPLLAARSRRLGGWLFVAANHRTTTCVLLGLILALLGVFYPFLGVRRVEARLEGMTVPVDLVERSPSGERSSRFELVPFHPQFRPYLTYPGDSRSILGRSGLLEAGPAPLGPFRRTSLLISKDTPQRPSAHVLIAPTSNLVRMTLNPENFRLELSVSSKDHRTFTPFRIQPYHGQIIWIATVPPPPIDAPEMEPYKQIRLTLEKTARHGNTVSNGRVIRPVMPVPDWALTLQTGDTIIIQLEEQKEGAKAWQPYLRREESVGPFPGIQEIQIDAN